MYSKHEVKAKGWNENSCIRLIDSNAAIYFIDGENIYHFVIDNHSNRVLKSVERDIFNWGNELCRKLTLTTRSPDRDEVGKI